MPKRSNSVPLGTPDPIQYLMDNGTTVMQLAVAWNFKTTAAVYNLKRADYVPTPKTAERMGESFGWTAGEVIDHWLEAVGSREVAR